MGGRCKTDKGDTPPVAKNKPPGGKRVAGKEGTRGVGGGGGGGGDTALSPKKKKRRAQTPRSQEKKIEKTNEKSQKGKNCYLQKA